MRPGRHFLFRVWKKTEERRRNTDTKSKCGPQSKADSSHREVTTSQDAEFINPQMGAHWRQGHRVDPRAFDRWCAAAVWQPGSPRGPQHASNASTGAPRRGRHRASLSRFNLLGPSREHNNPKCRNQLRHHEYYNARKPQGINAGITNIKYNTQKYPRYQCRDHAFADRREAV